MRDFGGRLAGSMNRNTHKNPAMLRVPVLFGELHPRTYIAVYSLKVISRFFDISYSYTTG